MTRKTPAARALVGCLALDSDAPINRCFELAGYSLKLAEPVNFGNYNAFRCSADRRLVIRDGRIVKSTRNAGVAAAWLRKLGRKLTALGVGKAAA